MNTCLHKDMQDLTNDLRQACLDETGLELVIRPFNRYNPSGGPWFLLATTQWPAYPYPKFWVEKEGREGKLYYAFYVEKGFAPVTATVDERLPSFGMIIRDNWYWYHFLHAIYESKFLEVTNKVSKAFQASLRLYVDGLYPGGMTIIEDGNWDFDNIDEYYSEYSAGRIWFDLLDDGSLACVETRYIKELDLVSKCTSITELANEVCKGGKLDWIWINVQIGVLLKPTEKIESGNWSPGEIWKGLLSPWLPWVISKG